MNKAMFFDTLSPEDQQAWTRLTLYLRDKIPAVVAFSGGVDSGLLAAALYQTVGEQMLAVFVDSRVHTEEDRRMVRLAAEQAGFPLQILPFDDLSQEAFCANPVDRCYVCKLQRFQALRAFAREQQVAFLMEGSNADDHNDYRPGMRAVEELGVLSPLTACNIDKAQVRRLARAMNLPIWDRPSAPCLATRVPYGSRITAEGLEQIRSAEADLSARGFSNVRVRSDGATARIEINPAQFEHFMNERQEILRQMKSIGFVHVTLDLEGYRRGSNNEGIVK